MAADSTAMTVEYLRARLLSERSLSRTARQRADQLAKRVAELEDQLRIVTKQRKKAEKAAIEVLSILETQGLNGDFSEVIDSSSDLEEIPCQQKGSHDHPHAVKEDDSSNMSKPDTSEVDDALSESESQISPTQGMSKILSWKGVNRPASLVTNGDKKIDHNRQRQGRSFLSAVDSFPRHPLGKSCRKIKRKEMGCAVENGKNRPDEFQHLGIKEHDTDDDFSNNKDKIDDQTKYDDDDNIKSTQNGVHKDEEMEQALEKQARLILRYQAEEDSQREWEEKFKENNVSSKDATRLPNGKVCEENKPNSVNDPTSDGPLDEVSDGSEAKNTRDSAVTAPNESVSHGSSTDLYNSMVQHIDEAQQADEEGPVKLKKSSQEFEFSGKDILCTRVEDQGIMGVKSGLDSRGSSNLTLPINNSPSYESRSSDQSNLLFLSGQNDNNDSSRLGHVLETLHSAKLSLMQELNRSPTQNHSNHNQNHTSGIRSSDILDIPTSSAHLFRLPTEGVPAVPRSDLSRLLYYNTPSAIASSHPVDAVNSSNSFHRTTDTERNYGGVMPAYNMMYSYPSSLKPVRNDNNGFKNSYMDRVVRNSLDFKGV